MDVEVINPRNDNYTGSFIFLHGAGRNGKWQKQMFMELLGEKASFSHIKIIFPTSRKGYFFIEDKVTNVWFDLEKPEKGSVAATKLDDIDNAARSIQQIIEEEERNGIPMNRIVVGGISQGGMLSLHCVYRFCPGVAGCVVASSALLHGETIMEAIRKRSNNPPILITHGVNDEAIPIAIGREMIEKMKCTGVNIEFHEFTEAFHELNQEELELIFKKVKQLIPENYK